MERVNQFLKKTYHLLRWHSRTVDDKCNTRHLSTRAIFVPSNCEERFLPPFNFGLWATIRQKLFKTSIFERKNWTKRGSPSKFHIWGSLYMQYMLCVCAILVYQSVGKGSSFSTIQFWVCRLFSLFNLRLWATVRQKLFETSIFEKENWTKRGSPSKFHIWGSLYMQYMLCVCVCAILVYQSVGKGSSFSTIQFWVCRLFSLLNLGLWATVRQKLFKTSIFEKENWTKRGSPSKFHIWWSFYMQYMLCVCHLSVPECGQRLIIFNHPIVKKGFFCPLILGCEPRFVKNCSKRAFLKGRIEPKKQPLQIPHLGIYMQ